MKMIEKWKQSARTIKQELHAIYLACKDPRTPWYAKAMAVCIVGYALSPIDLIPDFVPILGYVDDLILLPLGIAMVKRMIPPAVFDECRSKAKEASAKGFRKNWIAAGVIIAIWVMLAVLAFIWLKEYFL
jgi:uncharacterized membrane protein YkvA (DUF1232 family)